ncbi:hypothetical protein K474DRAFT_1713470 [Panus rudis PR-1116 ss-1]|nr:hypothetical protein K474DRAFT_1713470 [Panus rudis PR-1116 ss-1]
MAVQLLVLPALDATGKLVFTLVRDDPMRPRSKVEMRGWIGGIAGYARGSITFWVNGLDSRYSAVPLALLEVPHYWVHLTLSQSICYRIAQFGVVSVKSFKANAADTRGIIITSRAVTPHLDPDDISFLQTMGSDSESSDHGSWCPPV